MTQAEGISINLLFAHALRIRLDSEIKDDDKRNLIGKINNLATSDVATLTRVMEIWITGRSYTSCVQLKLTASTKSYLFRSRWGWPFGSCMSFWAGGWYLPPRVRSGVTTSPSSLVGLAVILMTLPLPSYLAKVIQTLQKSSKKKVCFIFFQFLFY
jgi:hypothetical protein